MHLRANTLDDLLDASFKLLLKSKMRVSPTKGPNVEEQGVVLELTSPRARLSRAAEKGHVFSCLGELFWYISCKRDLASIQYYIQRYDDYAEPDGTIWGAYGPRIFGGERSQYEVIRDRLATKPDTRKAVIQLFDRDDILADYEDVPCTCTLQFLVRDGWRLNEAGLPLGHQSLFAARTPNPSGDRVHGSQQSPALRQAVPRSGFRPVLNVPSWRSADSGQVGSSLAASLLEQRIDLTAGAV